LTVEEFHSALARADNLSRHATPAASARPATAAAAKATAIAAAETAALPVTTAAAEVAAV
jgi:hypothetical protein